MPRGTEDTASFFSQRRASYPQNIRIKRYSMLSSLCRNLFDFSQFFSFSFQRSKTCALLSFFDKIKTKMKKKLLNVYLKNKKNN